MITKELSNDIIAEKASNALLYRGYCNNIDEAKQGGYYLTQEGLTSATSLPTMKAGVLEVYERQGGVLQRLCSYQNPGIFYQRFYSKVAVAWSEWYQFNGTKITS